MTEFVGEYDMERYTDMLEELLALDHGLSLKTIDLLDRYTEWEGCFTQPMADTVEKIWEQQF